MSLNFNWVNSIILHSFKGSVSKWKSNYSKSNRKFRSKAFNILNLYSISSLIVCPNDNGSRFMLIWNSRFPEVVNLPCWKCLMHIHYLVKQYLFIFDIPRAQWSLNENSSWKMFKYHSTFSRTKFKQFSWTICIVSRIVGPSFDMVTI